MSEPNPTYGKSDFVAIAKQIKDAIETEVEDNPEIIKAKITELAALTGSAAALQANAKKALLMKEGQLLRLYEKDGLPPSVLMRKITADAFDEAGWLIFAERLNAGLSHSIEGLRSVLSYIKSDMEQSRNQQG